MVEPLPLVPATWMTGGSRSCGRPMRSSNPICRSRCRSMSLGWSARRRLRIASVRDMAERFYQTAMPEIGAPENRLFCVRGFGRGGDEIVVGAENRGGGRSRLRHRRGLRNVHPGLSLGQDADERPDRGTQVVAVDDHIHHAVLVEVFGALEALGQLLADGLLDDAGAGEADEGAGLGDVDVA